MKKILNQEIISYLIFGVLTTIVYFVLRFLVVNLTGQSLLAVVIAQMGAILFAFVTNKLFVFKDNQREVKELFRQFWFFLLGRGFVFLLDVVITYVAVERYASYFIIWLHLDKLPYDAAVFQSSFLSKFIGTPELANEFLFALLVQVLAIVLNYLISKKKVFKKKD
ncbi:GtrA family protein [Vagococcus sp. DIV0080]|uniref:GtrA family protein n=1 Tax=Candidatus Vagococcus giribetii TaxID=2230876 RepID=A0ABS3HWS2_9ENTE|nr:GtrA family protein [Vagococcus sp. DIV0080]MBO0477276.1 GtrA family protein [Vagococcus sp. DIV0080]